jgi:signal peptidase II
VAVLVGVAVGVWLIDQVSKWLVVAHLEGHPPIVLIQGWLSLAALRNPGAAFSLGTGTTFVFTAIAIAVVVVIVRTSRRLGSLWWAVALGGLLGGAVGNLTDRVFRSPGFPSGHVVDFVSVEHFAVFNCADMAIVGSAILMVALTVFGVELSGERTRPGSSRRPGPPADPAGPGQPAAPVTPHSADPPEPVDRTA